MKYKKVMALFLSAALTAAGLNSCSLQPIPAFGMETEVTDGEVIADGAEENTQEPAYPDEEPAYEEEARDEDGSMQNEEPIEAEQVESCGNDEAAPADPGGEVVEEGTAPEDDGRSETIPSDEDGQAPGQEEMAPAQEKVQPGDAGDGSQAETPDTQETDAGDHSAKEADDEAETGGSNEIVTEDPSGTDADAAQENMDPAGEFPSEQTADQEGLIEPLYDTAFSEGPAIEEVLAENMTEPEADTETETEFERDDSDDPGERSGSGGAYFSGGSYWDKSWYFRRDFRFTRVDKIYGIANKSRLARIYEEADTHADIVGEIPYFGLAYVLDEKDGFYYIESGDARGFIPKEDLTIGDYADETVTLMGETAFDGADADVEISDNDAFTYTRTTTQEVLTDKDYAITYTAGSILEYPRENARTIGELESGTLVYVLEDAGDGWLFVESGDVRGFTRSEMLLTGEGARAVTEDMGEGTISLAEEIISPEENRSLYYTLLSVKPAVNQIGESLCEYALSFEGKLPYVYGGTSLGFGADCSGFTQSIFGCFGISIPRLAQEQGVSGEAVGGLENARPGDIVYYGSGPHVGIYLGGGKVIHCSGNSGNTAENPGKGPTISDADYMPITSIRRYIIETDGNVPGISSNGNRQDGSIYSQDELELIWAIVAQEDNGSYEGALAVISSAMNRTESAAWGYCGSDALTQLTAPGQYCYSLDDYWKPRLGGNVPEYVKQAVNDCLVKGIRNHNHTSFRSTKGKTTGNDAVQIGGNWYFGA